MKYFVEEIAEKILQDTCYQSDKSIIVFPNRRAGVFLRKYLKTSDKFIFLPQIIGMDDFVEMTSGMKIVKNEFLLFELFRIHKNISKINGNDKYQSFEEFIPFADMLLKDFSDVDLHLVDAKQLFTNLFEEKELEHWDVSRPEEKSEFQQKYLSFFKSLYDYYSQLHDTLTEANKAYSAMIYRNVAENIETYADTMQWEKIMFVGFCEISQSESEIIKTLIRHGKAEFISDGDAYYRYDADNEAGMMLRRNIENFGDGEKQIEEYYGPDKREYTFVSCPEKILQSEYVGNIISKIADTKKDSDTNPFEDMAIVLCDETLLVPTLNALPECVDKVNITMGFPYTQSLTHDLLHKMLEMYESHEKRGYNVKAVIRFLSHHLIEKYLGISDLESRLTKQFTKDKIYFISGNDLIEKVKEIKGNGLAFLFDKEDMPSAELIDKYKTLAKGIYTTCDDTREQISLAASYEIFDHFGELQEVYRFADNIGVLRRIYDRIAMCMRLSFKGEPVEGLQIMGLQETKNIDFGNLIVISCNEGVIPKGNTHNSLIPFNLRKAFGMFTYQERDAAEAYNFYRMLQRAGKVHFLYSTETEGNGKGKGEASRFLTQIKKELLPKYPNIKLEEITLCTTQSSVSNIDTISKEKNDAVMELILQKAKEGHGLSPSALNNLRKCGLRYYFNNILGIKPSDELEEDIDVSEHGTLIHGTLEKIFKPFVGKEINPDELPDNNDIESMIEAVFEEKVFNSRKRSGENFFLMEIAKNQIINFIKLQKEELQKRKSTLECVEDEQKITMKIGEISEVFESKDCKSREIMPHGVADRIDTVEGVVRIGDYKSGKVDNAELKVDAKYFDTESMTYVGEKISDKWFQVMYYAWLYWREHKPARMEAGIYPLQNFGTFFLPAKIQYDRSTLDTSFSAKHFELFEKYVKDLLSTIFDKDIPFEQNKKKCQFCPFTKICGVEEKTF